jgi:hypothetical protein
MNHAVRIENPARASGVQVSFWILAKSDAKVVLLDPWTPKKVLFGFLGGLVHP